MHWRCLVRRTLHAPHLRAGAIPRTPELALALACTRHLTVLDRVASLASQTMSSVAALPAKSILF